jgi:hypothetical protein
LKSHLHDCAATTLATSRVKKTSFFFTTSLLYSFVKIDSSRIVALGDKSMERDYSIIQPQ